MTDTENVPENGTKHDIDYITTDSGNADKLVREHGQDFRYCEPLGGWLHWNGVRWQVDNAAVWEAAEQVGRELQHEAADATHKDEADRLWQHGRYTLGVPGIRRMIDKAQHDNRVIVGAGWFDADPHLLNVQNDPVDVRTGRLKPHGRNDLITKLSPVRYDPEAGADVWQGFVERVLPDQDVRRYV